MAKDRSRWWRIVQGLLAVGVVVAVFAAVIPGIADYAQVWQLVAGLTWLQVGMVAAAATFNLLTYWIQSVAALPGLTLPMAAVQNQTTTTIANTVPGGGALAVGVSFGMLRSWGYSEADVTRYTLVTGIWNTYIKLGLPAIALGLVVIEGRASRQLAWAAAIGVVVLLVSIAVLVLVLWKESLAERIGRTLQRPVRWVKRRFRKDGGGDWGSAAVRFRNETVDLLRVRWHWLTIATVISHVFLFLTLLASLRVVGVPQSEVSWIDALAAFSFARLVTALPITPGGLGVIELSYIGALVWAGGERADVVAAVLLFRALTYFLQIPLGAIAYPIWQATKERWRRADRPRKSARPARERVGAAA